MFKKILGALIMAICIAVGIFMVGTGHYLTWSAIINKDFMDFWIAFAITIFGWVILLGGFSIGTFFCSYEKINGELNNKLKDFNKQIDEAIDKLIDEKE